MKLLNIHRLTPSTPNVNFTLIIIPDGITSIEEATFGLNPVSDLMLKYIVLPQSVTKIYFKSFPTDYALERIYFFGTEAQWEAIKMFNYREKWKYVEVVFTDKIPTLEELER